MNDERMPSASGSVLSSAMLIDQVFLYFLIAAGVIVSLPALWLLMRARWPERVEKLRVVSNRNMLLSFLAGLPTLGVVIALLFQLGKLGKRGDIPLVFVVGLIAVFLAISSLAGLAGLATLIGERLTSATSTAEPWKTTLRGGVVLVFLISMPYVGWFALLPIGIVTGGGMILRSFLVRTPRPALAPGPQPQMAPATPPAIPSQVPAQTA